MNVPLPPDDDLLDYVCGELNDDHRATVERRIQSDAPLREEARRLSAVAARLREASATGLSDDFDQRLWDQLEAEQTPQASPVPVHRRHRFARFLPIPLAAAAVALVAVLFLWPNRVTGAVAWADVVRAMNGVNHFHAVAYHDSPNRADESERLVRIELFYLAPNRWRAQALRYVQFANSETSRVYDAEKRAFVGPESVRLRLIPEEFRESVAQGDLLTAILASIFNGKPPEGHPVKSDISDPTGGIEVFDFARDTTQRWARIWVLRATRLPLQIKVFEPRSNRFTLVAFDYTDPQPVEYFDADLFEQRVRDLGLTKPEDILRAGAAPINGNPTDRGHVHEMLGDYKPAVIVDTAGNADGAIMVVHTDPENVAPPGGHVEGAYETPKDNWGNVYHRSCAFRPAGGNWHGFYVPVPPFKRGQGERVVTFAYAIEVQSPAVGKGWSHDLTYRVLRTDQVVIGLDTAAKAAPTQQAKYWSADAIRGARVWYLREAAPALEQWQYVVEELKTRPEDFDLNLWAYNLLKCHGQRDEAHKIMTERLLPTYLSNPITCSRSADWEVSEHLRQVYREDGLDAVMPAIVALRKAHASAVNSKDPGIRDEASHVFGKPHSTLAWVLQLPEAAARFAAAPKPQVQDVIRGEDGYLVVRVSLPRDPMQLGEKTPWNSWMPSGPVTNGVRVLTSYHRPEEPGSCAWLIEPNAEFHESLRVRFRPYLIGRSGRGETEFQTEWSLDIPMPARPNAPSATQWWSEHVTQKPWQPIVSSQYVDLLRRAAESRNHEQVIALYRQLLELPKEQWPDYTFHPANAPLNLYESNRRRFQLEILKAQIHLGHRDEVLSALSTMEASLPPFDPRSDDYATMREAMWRRAETRAVRLEAVRYLMDTGRLDDAQAMLDTIGKDRPSALALSDRMVYLRPSDNSITSFIPRRELRDHWREFDTVQWELVRRRAQP